MNEAERTKPRAMYVEEAIQLALESRWTDAASVNRRLIEQYGPDEEAYNRLGKALTELGQLDDALAAYQETLTLNPINLIAPKMVRKLTSLMETPAKVEATHAAIDVDLFTEEPGKSALTTLIPPTGGVEEKVAPGDVVDLVVEDTTLAARTTRGVDLGGVDPKLARRLVPLIETGNRYTAAVARVDAGHIEVMIRESFQAPENSRKASFPTARGARRDDFRPYAKESLLVRDDDDGAASDDDDEDTAFRGGEAEDADGGAAADSDVDEPMAGFDDDEDDEDVRPEDSY